MGHMVLHMALPTSISRSIAESVASRLEASGITGRDAAARTGIANSTLSRRLTGHSPFTVTELEALAGLLGVTVAELVATERVA